MSVLVTVGQEDGYGEVDIVSGGQPAWVWMPVAVVQLGSGSPQRVGVHVDTVTSDKLLSGHPQGTLTLV